MPIPAMFKSLFKGKLAAPAEAHTQEAALSEIDEKAVPADVGERRRGIAKIEALYRVFPKGSKALWALYASLFLYVYANTLGSSTVDSFYAFATSSFGEHAVLSTINVMAGIIGGVGKSLCLLFWFHDGGTIIFGRAYLLNVFTCYRPTFRSSACGYDI